MRLVRSLRGRNLRLFCIAAALSAASLPSCAAPTYISFDLAGSAGTYPQAINTHSDITGYYLTPPNASHGFVSRTEPS
jgi:hypothetical protein